MFQLGICSCKTGIYAKYLHDLLCKWHVFLFFTLFCINAWLCMRVVLKIRMCADMYVWKSLRIYMYVHIRAMYLCECFVYIYPLHLTFCVFRMFVCCVINRSY